LEVENSGSGSRNVAQLMYCRYQNGAVLLFILLPCMFIDIFEPVVERRAGNWGLGFFGDN
jgi:hypothetical protein